MQRPTSERWWLNTIAGSSSGASSFPLGKIISQACCSNKTYLNLCGMLSNTKIEKYEHRNAMLVKCYVPSNREPIMLDKKGATTLSYLISTNLTSLNYIFKITPILLSFLVMYIISWERILGLGCRLDTQSQRASQMGSRS